MCILKLNKLNKKYNELKKIELHKGFGKVANNIVTHSADFQGCSRKLSTCDMVTVGNIS